MPSVKIKILSAVFFGVIGFAHAAALYNLETTAAKLCHNTLLKGDKFVFVKNCPYGKSNKQYFNYCKYR